MQSYQCKGLFIFIYGLKIPLFRDMTPCPVVTTYHSTGVIYRHILYQHRCDNPKCRILVVYAKALLVSQMIRHITEKLNGKDVHGSGRGLIGGTNSTFVRDSGKPDESSVRISGPMPRQDLP